MRRAVAGAVVLAATGMVVLTGCSGAFGSGAGGAGSGGPGNGGPGSGGGAGDDATHPALVEAGRTEAAAFDADAVTDGGPVTTDLVDDAWLDATAEATGIPRRALEGYAGAALATADSDPECRLGWTTLAGIGWVESHHGEIFGGTILDDGRTSEPIYGVQLDGGAFQSIPDTDRGTVDADPEWDRAVGPMQIIPATWAAWNTDADGDGIRDIHDVDDAALAAADYLCYSGGDLSTEAGWRDAITSYNQDDAYRADVLDAANRYAAASTGG